MIQRAQQGMNNFKAKVLSTLNFRMLALMLILGFYSGLPFNLVGQTLQAWFTMEHASLVSIGLVTLVAQIFSFKFLWAPCLDRWRILGLSRRRGWLMLCQGFLFLGLVTMAFLSPQTPGVLLVTAVFVCVMAASQDIVIDAFRTEVLMPAERGLGSSVFIGGYRLAMLCSGGLALYLAGTIGWSFVYIMMAILFLPGLVITYLQHETTVAAPSGSLAQTFSAPIRELLSRKNIVWLIGIMVFYKACDHGLNIIIIPFLLRELHFSLSFVGATFQGVGLFATMLGMLVGGILLTRFSLVPLLLGFALLQAGTILLFINMAYAQPDQTMFYFSVFSENFCNGLGTCALVTLIMSVCNQTYTATQFAIFSSLTNITRLLLAPIVGWIVEQFGYPFYFWLTFFSAFPAILLLIWAIKNKAKLLQFISSSPTQTPVAI